ncbi:MAG: hypothetical protein F6K11_10685 [Leptolyngbya sp. SIO3F4]|nr:hypothetical protein [Leptolyngbya sp. SIO3F4]
MANIFDDVLAWLAMEGYELVDQGIYTKNAHDDELFGFQVMKDVKTGVSLVRFMDSGGMWIDLPFIECPSLIQFIAIVKNFERMDAELIQDNALFHKVVDERNALRKQLDERQGKGMEAVT